MHAKISPAKMRLLSTTLAALAFMAPAVHAAEPRVALSGAVSPQPRLRSARLMGRLDPASAIHTGLILPLRNQAGLAELLRRQYTPGDPLFHQFLTPPEFTAKFGPTQADYDAVAAYARAQGLTITGKSEGRTLLNVAGPSAKIEAAFGVRMGRYRLANGSLAYSNSAAPVLPRSVAGRLAGIAGLNNLARMHPHFRRLNPNAPAPITGGGGSGSGPLGGLSPNDIKYAYELSGITPLYGTSTAAPAGALTGAGQNIGLFELDGYVAGDVAQYASQFSLPTVLTGTASSVTPVLLHGFKGAPTSVGGQTEVTLDIDMVLALAPAATGIYVYEEDQQTDITAPLTVFAAMANSKDSSNKPLLQVISCSWGIDETGEDPAIISGENTIFQQMAAQGQSLFCASGDSGAYDGYQIITTGTGTTIVSTGLTSPVTDNPASQPYATGVGGTTLSFTKPGTTAAGIATPGLYGGEVVWSAGTSSVNPEGSGGGISTLFAKPAYQIGFGVSPIRREVPDVSLNADPNTGYSIFVGNTGTDTTKGAAEVVGGTSAAAPLWAAFAALVNQQRTLNGLGSVGFVNPLLYPIASGSRYSANFHDIVSGTNLFYRAGAGYDDASGLGTFRGAPLLAALSFNPSQGTGTATLSGAVTDNSLPPVPLAGATVSATVSTTGAVAASTITDATGAYTLSVPSGLSLKITVDTSTLTAPTTTKFTGASQLEPALDIGATAILPFVLSPAYTYPVGLQMISAPFDYSGIADFAGIFSVPTVASGRSARLIQYSPALSSYLFSPTAPADTLRLGQGYWVSFPSANYLHVAGTPAPASAFTIPLQQGWNQIGDPFQLAAPLASISVIGSRGTSGLLPSTPSVVQPTLYAFPAGSNAYTALNPASDSLAPYAGYWIFAFQKCSLSVPYPGAPPPPTVPTVPGL